MAKRNLILIISIITLIVVESVFFYFILTLPLYKKYTVRYLAIVIAILFSLTYLKINKKIALASLGFALTGVADYFLAYSNPIQELSGVTLFCAVQLAYFAYLFLLQEEKKSRIIHLVLRIMVVVIAQVVLRIVVGERVDTLSKRSLFYIANLVVNLIIAITLKNKHPLFALGLALFLCCDIVVGLNSAIGVYIDIPRNNIFYKIAFSDFDFAWFFYLPSQVIIAISIMLKGKTPFFVPKRIRERYE